MRRHLSGDPEVVKKTALLDSQERECGKKSSKVQSSKWQKLNGAVGNASVLRNKWSGCLHVTRRGTWSVPEGLPREIAGGFPEGYLKGTWRVA